MLRVKQWKEHIWKIRFWRGCGLWRPIIFVQQFYFRTLCWALSVCSSPFNSNRANNANKQNCFCHISKQMVFEVFKVVWFANDYTLHSLKFLYWTLILTICYCCTSKYLLNLMIFIWTRITINLPFLLRRGVVTRYTFSSLSIRLLLTAIVLEKGLH